MTLRFLPLALLVFCTVGYAQTPRPLTPADTQAINTLIQKMTLDQKLDYIGGTGFAIRAVPSLNLPAFEMSDGPVGTRSNAGFPSTTYAGGIGLAASWDRDLASAIGAGIGRDARARGVHFMLGPGVNIYRSPRNGRNFEYFGEDPFLGAAMDVGYITGMQAQGVSATVKHFLGNNSEFLRHDSDTHVDERTAREIYLPTFEAAVTKAHVGAIMDSYNLVDGLHATQNPHFNAEIVRKEWGFPGVMMSDWVATYDAAGAANGGLDLEMPTGKFMNRANLTDAVKSGKVPQAVIDDKIRHILNTAMAFGWTTRSQTDSSISVIDAANRAVALRSAEESAVLLKNDGNLLPLNKKEIKTILVVGPDAFPGVPVGGGSAGVVPFHLVSAVEGLSTNLGTAVNVLYDRGIPTFSDLAAHTDFTTPDGKPGLQVETFSNPNLSGSPSRTATILHVNAKGLDIKSIVDNPEVLATLMNGSFKPEVFSRRWSGNYTAATDADYLVILEGSGEGSGNRLSIDGKQVIEDWRLVRAYQPSITLHLAAGPHTVLLEDKQEGDFGGHIGLAITPAATIVSENAKTLAAKADLILVSAGFDHDTESEGGDRTFTLPYGQDQLILAMAAANRKTIVSLTSGGNADSSLWIDQVPVLLTTWYSGEQGGTALAEILTGQINPSGHLPVTFERRAEDNPTFANYYPEGDSKVVTYKEGLFVGYRGYQKNNTKPLCPFGFGLSYTSFSFANLVVARTSSGTEARFTASFAVTNTGKVAGAEVAQLYLSELHPTVPRPIRELKGFERVQLAPGETKHLSIPLDPRAFATWDTNKKAWSIHPGEFTAEVGDSVESLPLKAPLKLSSEVARTPF